MDGEEIESLATAITGLQLKVFDSIYVVVVVVISLLGLLPRGEPPPLLRPVAGGFGVAFAAATGCCEGKSRRSSCRKKGHRFGSGVGGGKNRLLTRASKKKKKIWSVLFRAYSGRRRIRRDFRGLSKLSCWRGLSSDYLGVTFNCPTKLNSLEFFWLWRCANKAMRNSPETPPPPSFVCLLTLSYQSPESSPSSSSIRWKWTANKNMGETPLLLHSRRRPFDSFL